MTESNDMLAQNLVAGQAAAEFVSTTGGLPEITRRSADLRTAIDQTREEIEGAVFASRFPTSASDWFGVISTNGSNFTISTMQAVDEEGEAGFKRASLKARLDTAEGALFSLIDEITAIRTDLKVSQEEF